MADGTTARHLRPSETALIMVMLASKRDEESLKQELASALVEEISDGGMGSLKFVGPAERKCCARLAKGTGQRVRVTVFSYSWQPVRLSRLYLLKRMFQAKSHALRPFRIEVAAKVTFLTTAYY